jgi:hypothetical protein
VVPLALLLLAGPARAGDAARDAPRAAIDPDAAGSVDPADSWLTAPAPPDDPAAPHLVRPILLAGFGGGLGGSDLWLGADLGLRVDRVTARAAWRLVSLGSDYAEGWTGRLGAVVLERKWFALHGAVGGGLLTRTYAAGASVSGTVGTFDVGLLFFPRWAVGPAFSLSLEAIAPAGGSGHIGSPVFAVYGTVNMVALLLTALHLP